MAEPTNTRSRRWLWLLLISVIFIGVNIAYPYLLPQAPIVEGAAGDVLYAAGFDGFEDEWQQSEGRDSHLISADDTLRISVETSSVIFSAAQPHFRNFDASVTTRAIAGSENNGYGMIFRLQQPTQGCTMPLAILCGLADVSAFGIGNWVKVAFERESATRYYMFLISSDGYYSVWRGDEDGAKEVSTWIASDTITTGLNAENRIRVIGRGEAFQFFINGSPVDLCIPDDPAAESVYYLGECLEGTMRRTFLDEALPTGQLAMVVTTVGLEPGVTIDFDDLIVISPTDNEEPQDL